MAKKRVTQAVTTDEPIRMAPRVSFDGEDLPEGLPSIERPVRLVVDGTLTRVSLEDGCDGRRASLSVKVKTVKVAKGKQREPQA